MDSSSIQFKTAQTRKDNYNVSAPVLRILGHRFGGMAKTSERNREGKSKSRKLQRRIAYSPFQSGDESQRRYAPRKKKPSGCDLETVETLGPGFDHTKQKPIPYRPFQTKQHVAMGNIRCCSGDSGTS